MKKISGKTILALLVLALALAAVFVFGCPIYRIFGIPCPACGVTRAWLCFFRGDLAGAFRYHLFFLPLPFFLILCFLYDRGLCGKFQKPVGIGLIVFAVALFGYYLVRLFGQPNYFS